MRLKGGGAEVVLSRSHPEFVRQLLIQEVPEIASGAVVIETIVREPGYRTKLAVRSTDLKVDPVGACVGMRGVRIKNVVRKLNNEKIDVIPYSADVIELLQNALAPVEIRKIRTEEREISIVVEDEDFAAVIGKRGLNARLTGSLINYNLEVNCITDYNREIEMQRKALAFVDNPALSLPLTGIEGVKPFMFQHFVAEGFHTAGDFLRASPDELMKISGVSRELAEDILDKVRKQLSIE